MVRVEPEKSPLNQPLAALDLTEYQMLDLICPVRREHKQARRRLRRGPFSRSRRAR
jgi:hypothetical protein